MFITYIPGGDTYRMCLSCLLLFFVVVCLLWWPCAVRLRDAQLVMEDIKRTVGELEQESSFPSIAVELVDNELAILYMNSKKSEVRPDPPRRSQPHGAVVHIQDTPCIQS